MMWLRWLPLAEIWQFRGMKKSMEDKIFVEIKPNLVNLEKYNAVKMKYAAIIRRLRNFSEEHNLSDVIEGLAELSEKLAEDKFTLAILGQFKRGKSTLMNAIVGRNLLPTGVVPLTSAITILRYGPQEKLLIEKEKLLFPQEYPMSSLADFVTETHNPGNSKNVKRAVIEIPLPLFHQGVEFVDTPGVGSAITASTQTTYDFLPQCDAVIFVTSADSPLTEIELKFLDDIKKYTQKIFFVINKKDILNMGEYINVLTFVQKTLAMRGFYSKVHAISARDGLEAKLTKNKLQYSLSGLKALEEEIADFLSQKRQEVFSDNIAHHILMIMQKLVGEKIVLENPEFSQWLRGKMQAKSLLEAGPTSPVVAVPKKIPPLEALIEKLSVIKPERLRDDLHSTNCPQCQYLADIAFEFFRHYQYALAHDEAVQNEFLEKGGFCASHTWQLLKLLSAYDASLLYIPFVQKLLQKLRDIPPGNIPVETEGMQREHCPICHFLSMVSRLYAEKMATFLQTEKGKETYHQSHGLCFKHLRLLFKYLPDEQEKVYLWQQAIDYLGTTVEDMQSFVLKHEAVKRHLENVDEKDAYHRAVLHILGSAYASTIFTDEF